MIIETDFPDHWKIEALISSCGESALRCLLRLWAFAQIRKSDLLPKKQLEAIAKFQGQKGLFFSSLLELSLIEELGENEENFQNLVRLHDYAEVNGSLFARWKNGDEKANKAKAKRNASESQANGKRSGSESQAKHKRTASETEAKAKRNGSEDEANAERNGSEDEADGKRSGSESQAIDKIDKIDKILTPQTPLRVACAENFELGLDENLGAELSPEDIKRLQDKFAEWVDYRKTVKRKPIKPETARRQGKVVADCIDVDGLSVKQVLAMFDKAMQMEWQGWCFDEEILKKKALGEKKFNKNTPPAPLGVPLGAWQNEEPSVGM
mgnify:CR=1 FL=1